METSRIGRLEGRSILRPDISTREGVNKDAQILTGRRFLDREVLKNAAQGYAACREPQQFEHLESLTEGSSKGPEVGFLVPARIPSWSDDKGKQRSLTWWIVREIGMRWRGLGGHKGGFIANRDFCHRRDGGVEVAGREVMPGTGRWGTQLNWSDIFVSNEGGTEEQAVNTAFSMGQNQTDAEGTTAVIENPQNHGDRPGNVYRYERNSIVPIAPFWILCIAQHLYATLGIMAQSISTGMVQRRPTSGSLMSWWSDSNPPGPTIPLHSLAKPLLKYMHHRRAVEIIKRDEHEPISRGKLETLVTYLSRTSFKYILAATRVAIIDYFGQRASESEDEAQILLDGDILSHAGHLLESPDLYILRSTLRMLQRIVSHGSLIEQVLHHELCTQLVHLLSFEDAIVQERAVCTLAQISSGSGDAVHAVVRANVLDEAIRLLNSHNQTLVGATCWIIGKIARHGAHYDDVVILDPFQPLVSLLDLPAHPSNSHFPSFRRLSNAVSVLPEAVHLGNLFIQRNAIRALADVSSVSVDGAWAVVNAKALDKAVGNLAIHKSIRLVLAMHETDFQEPLTSLLHHTHPPVRTVAIYALGHMSQRTLADAYVPAQLLDPTVLWDRSKFLDSRVARWMAGESSVQMCHNKYGELGECLSLVASSRHRDEVVRANALDALRRIQLSSERGRSDSQKGLADVWPSIAGQAQCRHLTTK
ncbi:armadillo-type protein [Mycena maculata]|uniref:Armadillo-type protein n=1 Tax=Mycena maculata TaxID=230809 RepID=A0AAD7IWZ3_9AGAR|nr:armadillo-type protein [Mycena maculata]